MVMAMSIVVMMRGVMVMMSPVMSSWTRAGEYDTGHCGRRKHYCQFLVHVFLLFLSLLTIQIGKPPMKI
jgi:hypothetical protein